jgi:hypothetical protein
MIRTVKGMLGVAVVAAAGFAVVAVQPGFEGEAAGARRVRDIRPVSAGEISAAEAEAAAAYWTPARMEAAEPLALPKPAHGRPRLGVARDRGGRGTFVDAEGTHRLEAVGEVGPADAYTYPFPYTGRGVETQLYRKFPYSTIGKIFGIWDDGQPFTCTGASVASGPRQVVFTAGHCVQDETGAATRLVFVPAYRNGIQPFGAFAGFGTKWVLTPWQDSQDYSYDMAAFAVRVNRQGRKLQDAVGALGFAFNGSRVQHWELFGYPGNDPFTGESLQLCEASWAADDITEVGGVGPATIGVGCDMTEGSSGGPWLLRQRDEVTPLVVRSLLNGINSYGYIDDPADPPPYGSVAMFGPYFDSSANLLRCAAATNSATPPDSCLNPA